MTAGAAPGPVVQAVVGGPFLSESFEHRWMELVLYIDR